MRLFFDLRLGYLVEAPGQSTPASGYIGKAGDGQPVELQFGRSPDPLGSSILFEAPTWTSTGLPGGTVIQLAIKASGEFSDGPVLASTSTFSYDAGTKTYSGVVNLNTEQINTELERGNDDDTDDIASILCGLEVTYQSGGTGSWASSVLPVQYQINHDLIYGDEATPTNADDPDEYLLKQSGIEWYPTITSLTGGTAADLDSLITLTQAVGKSIEILDTDATPATVRRYILTAGTTAESAPDVIRPDDYAATTNEKVWVLQSYGAGSVAVGDITGLGTGVATALAVNVGSAGAPVVLDGAGGTPSSITLTNATGLPTAGILDDAVTADKLANTAVTPGSYTSTNLTVDAQGRITAAANGSGGGSNSLYAERSYFEGNAPLVVGTYPFMVARTAMTITRIDAEVDGTPLDPPTFYIYKNSDPLSSVITVDGGPNSYGNRHKSTAVSLSVAAGDRIELYVNDAGDYGGVDPAEGPLVIGLEFTRA